MDAFVKTQIIDTNARYMGVDMTEIVDKAGNGIARILAKNYGIKKTFNFVCGLGNNGADGIAAARHLFQLGAKNITVYLVGRISDIKSTAAKFHLEKLQRIDGVNILTDASAKDVVQAEITIECLVGTGIKGKLHKRFHDTIVRLTKQKTKIVAIDLPASNYKYDLSISMMYPKTEDAVVVDIGMPKDVDLYTGPGQVKAMNVPSQNSYKSQNGELLVLAGSEQFHGAAIMTIKAASKLIGSVFFYSTPENQNVAKAAKLELQEFICVSDNNLEKYAEYANAFLFGPGLEPNLPTRAIIQKLLQMYPDKPAVLDAYAIAAAVENKNLLKNKILTPHRGELRHIFGQDKRTEKLAQAGIEGKIKRFAIENECYVVLKGSTDILFSKYGDVMLNQTGNQGMAKGGTGDVLAGIIAAFLTQNDPWLAIQAACFVNGKAGDNLQAKYGYNYSATDLIPEIQSVINWAQNF